MQPSSRGSGRGLPTTSSRMSHPAECSPHSQKRAVVEKGANGSVLRRLSADQPLHPGWAGGERVPPHVRELRRPRGAVETGPVNTARLSQSWNEGVRGPPRTHATPEPSRCTRPSPLQGRGRGGPRGERLSSEPSGIIPAWLFLPGLHDVSLPRSPNEAFFFLVEGPGKLFQGQEFGKHPCSRG